MPEAQIAVHEVINKLMSLENPTSKDVHRLKLEVAARYHLNETLSNADVICCLSPEEEAKLLPILRRKNTRTISGVTIIAVMTKPMPCPQDEPCAYCPGGPEKGAPQSYTGHEPAAMRGEQNLYDPYMQVKSRINQLTAIGHKVDKIELIVMGGTFPSTPIEYQTWFLKRALDAITEKESTDLEEAKYNAEKSSRRNVGITVETRPDWAKKQHINIMLDMGVTRIELGIQNPDDAIYQKVGRTHTVADVIKATQTAKDSGLKIVYHMMPGMPGSNYKKDLKAFRTIFSNPDFKPDMIKIYPCLVIEGTKVSQWHSQGLYQPYSTEEAARLIAKIKKGIPPWVRVMRVQRDIPAQLITSGVKKSNLRQIVHELMLQKGEKCGCIRCREVGHKIIKNKCLDAGNIKLGSLTYDASEGKEIFISIDDLKNDALVGYLRLRIPSSKSFRPEITEVPSAIVRELHVYGPLVPVGKKSIQAWQHKGFGSQLLSEAERIAREEYDLKKLLVISALGTKEYYMRLGFERDGVYVSKKLRKL